MVAVRGKIEAKASDHLNVENRKQGSVLATYSADFVQGLPAFHRCFDVLGGLRSSF